MKGQVKLLSLLLLVCLTTYYSDAAVEEILVRKNVKSIKSIQKCANCDMMQLPDGSYFHKKCDAYDIEKCGEITEENYDCCVGFQTLRRTFDNYQAKDCEEDDICMEKMISYGTYGRMNATLKTLENIQIMKKYKQTTVFIEDINRNPIMPGVSDKKDLIAQLHMVEGRWYSQNLRDGQHLKSIVKDHLYHVSRYNKDRLYIDCVEMIEADRECKRGLVHLLKGSLVHRLYDYPTKKESVLKMLMRFDETKDFAEYLSDETKMKLDTFDSAMHYTVLAPKKEKWAEAIKLYKKDELTLIAENHVMERLWCLDGLVNTDKPIYSPFKQRLYFNNRTENGVEKYTVTGECNPVRNVEERDVVGTNGVMHIIDGPLVPMNLMRLDFKGEMPECLKKYKIDISWIYYKECDLYVDKFSNFTLIFPENSAYEWFKNYGKFKSEYKRFMEDKEYRCRTVRYHIMKSNEEATSALPLANVSQPWRTNNKNNYLYEQLYQVGDESDKDGKFDVRFHYSKLLDKWPISFLGTFLVRSDKINVLPEQNLTEIISERPNMKITDNILKKTELDKTEFKINAPKNLYLVVEDENLESKFDAEGNFIPREGGEAKWNEMVAKNYSLMHTIPNYLWGGDLGYFNKSIPYYFTNKMGVNLTFISTDGEDMLIGHSDLKKEDWAPVIKFNIPARDGIIWILKKPIPCPTKICGEPLYDIDIFKIQIAACNTDQLRNSKNAKKKFRSRGVLMAKKNPDDCFSSLVFVKELNSTVYRNP